MERRNGKKVLEIKKELLEKHGNKPVEWWAHKLAIARHDLSEETETVRVYHRASHDAERTADHLRIINRNLMRLLEKAGYQKSKLRVTENFYECKYIDGLTQEQIEDGEGCWAGHDECNECEECYKKMAVTTVCVYDYTIIDDVLQYIGADLGDGSTEFKDLLKVEDVTNPKKPIVIWEATNE